MRKIINRRKPDRVDVFGNDSPVKIDRLLETEEVGEGQELKLFEANDGGSYLAYEGIGDENLAVVARFDTSDNGFAHLRSLYRVEGFTESDYHDILERTEQLMFDEKAELPRSPEGEKPVPSDYGFANLDEGYKSKLEPAHCLVSEGKEGYKARTSSST